MLKGFKDFIFRGNIIDLAVAVIIGAAFTAVVASISDYVIKPILAVIGGVDAQGFGFQLNDNPNTFVDLGAVFGALIQFLITAGVVYFVVVVPMRKSLEFARSRQAAAEEKVEETQAADVALLTEIRDLLQEGNAARLGSAGPQSLPTAQPGKPTV